MSDLKRSAMNINHKRSLATCMIIYGLMAAFAFSVPLVTYFFDFAESTKQWSKAGYPEPQRTIPSLLKVMAVMQRSFIGIGVVLSACSVVAIWNLMHLNRKQKNHTAEPAATDNAV